MPLSPSVTSSKPFAPSKTEVLYILIYFTAFIGWRQLVYTTPWSIIASATLIKPAMFAPLT